MLFADTDELQNYLIYSPYQDEYKISWYKDCFEIKENHENIRLNNKTVVLVLYVIVCLI